MRNLRLWLLLIGLISIVMLGSCAQEKSDPKPFPHKDITFVVPYNAGGGQDSLARSIALGAEREFGHQMNIEIRAGAAGTLGWRHMLSKPSDGHTIMIGSLSPMIAVIGEELAPVKIDDVRLVSIVSDFNSHFVTRDQGPFKDWDSVKEYALANPGHLTIGGTLSQTLAAAAVFEQAGIKANIIPYPGTAAAVTDMLGGHIDIAVATPAVVLSLLGKASPVLNIGIYPNGEHLTSHIGNVPWVEDLELHGVSQPRWIGVHPDTPDEVVKRLDKGLSKILQHPEIVHRIESLGEEVIYSDAAASAQQYEDLITIIRSNLNSLQ